MIRVTLSPLRVYVFGRRVHHGLVGAILLLSDVHDWRVWIRDILNHPAGPVR